MYDVETELLFTSYFDPVVNSDKLYQKFKNTISDKYNFEEAEIVMTGEDFGFLCERYDALLYWLGVGTSSGDLHASTFLPAKESILVGVEVMYTLATQKSVDQ
jgi:N-acetyldiaminopimelate deacetylase